MGSKSVEAVCCLLHQPWPDFLAPLQHVALPEQLDGAADFNFGCARADVHRAICPMLLEVVVTPLANTCKASCTQLFELTRSYTPPAKETVHL
jgi:hypothetical protein